MSENTFKYNKKIVNSHKWKLADYFTYSDEWAKTVTGYKIVYYYGCEKCNTASFCTDINKLKHFYDIKHYNLTCEELQIEEILK